MCAGWVRCRRSSLFRIARRRSRPPSRWTLRSDARANGASYSCAPASTAMSFGRSCHSPSATRSSMKLSTYWRGRSMGDRMTLYRRREFLRRSALAAASVAVLSCAPGATGPGSSAGKSLTLAKGGVLTWGQWDKIDSIDPALTTGAAAGEIAQNILDTLITLDADQKPHPALATKWTIEDSGKKFTFTLRDGVKFHDGSTLTSAAVKQSFERILKPERKAGAVVSLVGPIDTITTPNDSTVIFNFKTGYYAFMLQIWRYFFGVMSPKYLATLKAGDLATTPVGSGPFMFDSRSPDGVVTLKAFPDFNWGAETFKNRGAAYLSSVKFRAITEPSTRIATLESGENLLIDEIPEADYARLKDNNKYAFVLSPRASHT